MAARWGHTLMENREGLVVGATLTPPTGTAEREAVSRTAVRMSGFSYLYETWLTIWPA